MDGRVPAVVLILLVAGLGTLSLEGISEDTQQDQSASIRLIPSTLSVEPGQILKVAVVVEDVADLQGFDVQFGYETDHLEYINHTDPMPVPSEEYPTPIPPSSYGGILARPRDASDILTIKNEVNTTTGRYWGVAVSLDLDTPFNGSGTIAVVTFRALDRQGTTDLKFITHDLSDPDAKPIPKTVLNASVAIWRLGISVIQPENRTYASSSVPLTFNLGKPVTWIGYSLDGQSNVTVSGNTTLNGISDGKHTIVVCANDTAGNEGRSLSAYFSVDTHPPSIVIVSPENKTYDSNSILVNWTIDESTSWIGYSLDGQANITISGGLVLSDLANGPHSLVVYATDDVGNTGSSSSLEFTTQEAAPGTPYAIAIIGIVIAAVLTIGVWVCLTKIRKRERGKQETGASTGQGS